MKRPCSLSASETHNRKNVNKSVAETLRAFEEVIAPALRSHMAVRGYVSTVWGCPYEGRSRSRGGPAHRPRAALAGLLPGVARRHHRRGHPAPDASASSRCSCARSRRRRSRCTCTTRAARRSPTCWWASRWASPRYDASVGGLGGCPYAPGAAGNLATEDLVYMLTAWASRPASTSTSSGRAGQGRQGHRGPRAARQGAQGRRSLAAHLSRPRLVDQQPSTEKPRAIAASQMQNRSLGSAQ
jgi:hypothetical protein